LSSRIKAQLRPYSIDWKLRHTRHKLPDVESQSLSALTLQLLTWVAEQPRTYGDVMEAWRTSCPRMPIWEDAMSQGLIDINGSGTMREREVKLSQRGRAMLGRR
jgi:hypothetical protein